MNFLHFGGMPMGMSMHGIHMGGQHVVHMGGNGMMMHLPHHIHDPHHGSGYRRVGGRIMAPPGARPSGPGHFACKYCTARHRNWDPTQRSTLHDTSCTRYHDHAAATREAERKAEQERARAQEEERKRQQELRQAEAERQRAQQEAQAATAAQALASAAAQEAAAAQALLDELGA